MIKTEILGKGEIIARRASAAPDVSAAVSEIIADVRKNGDEALLRLCERFDGARPDSLEASGAELAAAAEKADKKLVGILEKAADNIRRFHAAQLREGFSIGFADGSVIGQRVSPVERAGLYIPGGTAAYPSTVLMNCIPAKIAGVGEIIMCSPAKNGIINPDIAAAAKIAGVDRVFKLGGAQAIAAMAYGTESVPRADKITGPGNAYVAEAKRQIYGAAGIDMIAGPSEILIVADSGSDPDRLAADMLSQAEHDANASAVLITDSPELARATAEAVDRRLAELPRREIAGASIENNGRIIVADSISEAIEAANALAPEHLELCLDEPFEWLDKVKHAGSVFLGRHCPEAVGDYWAGANHTLPTGGTARFSSALSVDDFMKKTQFIYYTPAALDAAADDIAYFAEKEGLDGHARSALSRRS
ncbi:MAG: histidinol dehydrogenase [Oscillospiraceae bacterium]|jgi:histidinol dehydrogenase|nr:histidinol dehydrogenase [Oscillospiraceae bacterium]